MAIRLLIAESDRAASRLLEASLARYGFEVTHAEDGDTAVTSFAPHRFDVVLLDMSLPRKSGVDAAKAIRTSPGGNQVGIVLTSSNTVSPDVVLGLRRAQVDAWFNKPLSMRDLRDKLAELAHKYTGATSELLHVARGRRALSNVKKPTESTAAARAAVSTTTTRGSAGTSSLPKSGGGSRAAVQRAGTTSRGAPPSQNAPMTMRLSSADAAAAVDAAAALERAVPLAVQPAAGAAAVDDALANAAVVEPAVVDDKSVPAAVVLVPPAPAAAFDSPPATGAERVAAPPEPLAAEPRPVDEVHASARMMLALARARATGVYTLTLRDAEAKVAFISGVMVGAMDSSRENRLLSRLVRRGVLQEDDIEGVLTYSREHKLRAAEAVLALEHCDAETLLDELEQQAAARLVVAAAWRGGEMRFIEDKAEIERLAISSFDAYEAIFRRFDQLSDPVMVSAWLERARDDEITASRDFEDGLVAYARVAPKSPLPAILFSRPPSLKALEMQIEQWAPMERERLLAHVYGMWLAGLLRLPSDVIVDERPVPRPVRSEEVDRAVPDKAACSTVRGEWLRAQGRNYYEVLGVAQEADEPILSSALDAYREKFGEDTLGKKNIGPVSGLAEELWALVEDIETTLFDADQRAFYDATIAEQEEPSSLELVIDADSHFLEGKLALSHGDMKGAKEAFELAASSAPNNAEYKSFLAWTEFLEGAALVDSAMATLRDAAKSDVELMRPVLLIGLAAERLGNPDAARAAFEEARRRAPGNSEIESALSRVKRSGDG